MSQQAQTLQITQPVATAHVADWPSFWQQHGQPWRTEPEIKQKRQQHLIACLATPPDIEQGIYPFKGVQLHRADLEWLIAAYQSQRILEGMDLRGADLRQLDLSNMLLMHMCGGLNWREKLNSTPQQRENAAVLLQGANLRYAHLQGACLRQAHLEGADLKYAHLEGTILRYAHLAGANLQGTYLDATTDLKRTSFSDDKLSASFAGIHCSETDLTIVEWSEVKILGDEMEARQRAEPDGRPKEKEKRLSDCRNAIRAYQQLAVALQAQGQNDDAARFAYRSQVLQRRLYRLQFPRHFAAYIFSWLLALLTGYGSKPERALYWYVSVILSFAVLYYILGAVNGVHQPWYGPLLFSLREFHGRGFFAEQTASDSPQTIAAALEAFLGLFIEAGLIAAFTQRIFGK